MKYTARSIVTPKMTNIMITDETPTKMMFLLMWQKILRETDLTDKGLTIDLIITTGKRPQKNIRREKCTKNESN